MGNEEMGKWGNGRTMAQVVSQSRRSRGQWSVHIVQSIAKVMIS